MTEVKLSERAQKILENLGDLTLNPSPPSGEGLEICIRQQTLAEQFNCSRRTIGRALKELKEAGLLIDLNQRHENRCKMYLISPSLLGGEGPARSAGGEVLTPEAQSQWRLYSKTFGIVFRMFDGQEGRPVLEDCFKEVALKLKEVKIEEELYDKIFAELRLHPAYPAARESWFAGGRL